MKPIRWMATGLLSLLITPFASAAPSVWQGHIGRLPIVVERHVDETGKPACAGRYFYTRHRLDIRLDGEADAAGGCLLRELPSRWDEAAPKVQWRMRPAHNGQWRGEWIGLDGRRLPIQLTRVSASKLPPASDASLNSVRGEFEPYAWLRLTTLKLQPGKRETFQYRELQWQREPVSGIELFNVRAGYPANDLVRINRALARRHWAWIDESFECRSGNPTGEDGFDTAIATPRLMSDRLLSVSLFTSYYCGGAHPDFADVPLNLDVASGRELRLEDVFWIGKGEPLFKAVGGQDWNQAWADYRNNTFAPWVVEQFKRLYPQEMAVPSDPEDACDYHASEVWQFPAWYATPDGIHLAAYFYRAARACDNPDWAVLPWSLVQRHPGTLRP